MKGNNRWRGGQRVDLKSMPRTLFGQEKAEVISVIREDVGDPTCNIIVHDGKCGQIIYKNNGQGNKAVFGNPSKLDSQGNASRRLLLTGPYRLISMDGSILMEFNLGDHCHGKLFLDVDGPSTTYDEAVTQKVHPCTCHPPAVVTYALLTDAVEANVEIKLHQQKEDTIYGWISAHTDLGEVLLFESNNGNILSSSSQKSTIIPLARSVLAVPFTSSLKIEVNLHGRHSNNEIVKGFVTSYHDHLKSNHMLHLDGNNGHVEVKIAWSD